jgi:hypothetical protein|tara:strand:- start:2507 stop:3238 length:732 start_codon:yes stop_codon:yes gene_type:complete
MNKTKLIRFIDKYSLGGEIKSVKWSSNGKQLATRFISGDKSLVGSVVLDNFDDVETSDIGVYNTPQLVSLLSILEEDVDFSLQKMGDKFVSVNMKDSQHGTHSKYMLSDLSVIPTPPELKNLPSTFGLELKIDSYFINTFISGKSALPDTDTFTIIAKNDTANVIIGFSNVATNRVTIPVECEVFSDTEPISFNANMFANILTANKECEKAILKVSSDGLATISFNIDDYKSEYFLVATQQVT